MLFVLIILLPLNPSYVLELIVIVGLSAVLMLAWYNTLLTSNLCEIAVKYCLIKRVHLHVFVWWGEGGGVRTLCWPGVQIISVMCEFMKTRPSVS